MNMANIRIFIKNLSPIHKIVICIFAISLVYHLAQSFESFSNTNDYLKSSMIENCEEENAGNLEATRNCVKDVLAQRNESEKFNRLYSIAAITSLHAFLFPAYLVVFNLFSFLYKGYREKYRFSSMGLTEKVIHIFGMIYVAMLSLVIYLTYDTVSYNKKVPVIPFTASISDSSGEQMTIKGVWIKDIYQGKDVTLKNVAPSSGEVYSIDNAEIQCSKETMSCEHREITLTTSGGTTFLDTGIDKISQITTWDEHKVLSEDVYDCFIDRYTFDYTKDSALWTRIPTGTIGCQSRDFKPGSYKLWDGIDLNTELQANESGFLTKAIAALFD